MIRIKDLPDKSREDSWYFGFERFCEGKKRSKEAWIGVHKVTNPDYIAAFGKYVVFSWFIGGNEIYDTKLKAFNAAKKHLEKLKDEYRSGKRNWWTSELKKE